MRFYHVEPQGSGGIGYWLYMPKSLRGGPQKRQVEGRLEVSVMRALMGELDEHSIFYNVGAGWGYYTFAAAKVAARVFAFEAQQHRIDAMWAAWDRNGACNVDIWGGLVRSVDNCLASWAMPDVILMDVEGWEYEILRASPEALEAGPTWIIELHTGAEQFRPAPPEVSSRGALDVLRGHGYEIETINRRYGQSHIIAKAGRNDGHKTQVESD